MSIRILKIAIISCWLILLALLIQRDFFITSLGHNEQTTLMKIKHEQYYGVYLRNKRIGFVMEDFRPLGKDGFKVHQQANLKLKVVNSLQPLNMDLTAELDNKLQLTTFQFSFSSPLYTLKAKGRVEGNTIHFSLDTGQTVSEETITLHAPPMLPLNQRGYLLNRLTKVGEKLKIPFFDPLSQAGRESVITYQGKEKLLLNNRVYNLHRFTESYSGLKMDFWLNDKGKIIQEKLPAGFVLKAEPKFKAMDIETQNSLWKGR